MNQSAQRVHDLILDAFGAVTPPAKSEGVVEGTDRESREVAAAFEGRTWQSLDVAFVRANKDALPLLSPSWFRYYLPAYLLACLEDRIEVDVAWNSVVYGLTPPKRSDAVFRSRADGFSPQQARALLSYLELQYEEEKAAWQGEPPTDFRPSIAYWTARASAK